MLEVNGVVRNFGGLVAVDNVSFKVGKGQVLGFIGPNGAGKTTTMRILATLASVVSPSWIIPRKHAASLDSCRIMPASM